MVRATMRILSLFLWALFGWPVAVVQSVRARRRLHARRTELGLTVERVA
jgi:hypothetical protein